MRLFGRDSVSTPILAILDGLLLVVGFVVSLEVLVFLALLVNPSHPLRAYFQVTTIAEVPPAIWPTDGLVQVAPGSTSAAAEAEPWAYIRFRPGTRLFVLASVVVALAWRACIIIVLLLLRRVLLNISPASPFPRANIRCIRHMGWAILAMAVLDLLIGAGMMTYMRATVAVAGRPAVVPSAMLVANFPWGTILAGLAVVVLAEIFRAGADLQDEQSLTV